MFNPGEHGHRQAELRNLHLHRAALAKLHDRPEFRKACLDLVERWLVQPSLQASRPWLEQWRDMLASWDWQRLAETVLDEAAGQTLRQCSPLGPVLSPRERWSLLAEVERQLQAEKRETSP